MYTYIDSLRSRNIQGTVKGFGILYFIASQAENSCDDITRPGIHEAGWRLCFVHNFDIHDVNYDFVNDRGPMKH